MISPRVSLLLTPIAVALLFAMCTNIYPLAYQAGASISMVMWLRFLLSAFFFSAVDSQPFINRKLSKIDIRQLVFVGILLTLQSSGFVATLKFLPVSIAVTLFYTFPLFTYILNSLLNKSKLHPISLLFFGLALFGIWLLVNDGSTTNNILGIALALGASIMQAVLNVSSQKLKHLPVLQVSKYTVIIPATIYSIVVFFDHGVLQIKPVSWAVIAGVLFTMGLYLYFKSIASIGAVRTASILYFEPVFAIAISVLILHESLRDTQWLGIGIIIFASIMLEFVTRKWRKSHI